MDVTDLVRRLTRRRWSVLVVAVIAVVAAAVTWLGASASQQSSAAVVIVPPTLGSAVSDQNPLLNLDSNLAQLATVLSAALESTDAGDTLAAQGATASYSISTVTGTDPSFAQLSPQMVFTVTGTNVDVARRTASALVSLARTRLRALQVQADVPADARAGLLQIVAPTDGQSIGGGRVRSAGSVFLAILVLGLLAVLLADELLRRRFVPPQRAEPGAPVRQRRAARIAAQRDPDAPARTPRSR